MTEYTPGDLLAALSGNVGTALAYVGIAIGASLGSAFALIGIRKGIAWARTLTAEGRAETARWAAYESWNENDYSETGVGATHSGDWDDDDLQAPSW